MVDRKVLIAIPSGDMVHARFVTSLINMLASSRDCEILYCNQISSRIADNRNELVKFAQKANCTHILFIDADMTFPANGLITLLAHDRDIVGATTCKRQEGDESPIGLVAHSEDEITNKRLTEMAVMGFPFMLVKTDVFARLGVPYFAEPFDAEGNLIPEDTFFCEHARAAGYSIWCDIELSARMGHLGVKEYRIKPMRQETHPVVTLAA